MFCLPLHTLLIRTRHTKKRNYSIQWCASTVCVSAPRAVSVAVGVRRVGRNMVSVSEFSYLCYCQISIIRVWSVAADMSIRSGVCGPPGGRVGGPVSVVSSRVILLRCLRIRGPAGPANLCTRGRLPSNGKICLRSQSGAVGGHVARTQCAQLLYIYTCY